MLQNNLRKITGFQKKLNVEVPVGIYITNTLIFVSSLGAEKCIFLFTIREIYYLIITLVLIILFALSIFVCAYISLSLRRIVLFGLFTSVPEVRGWALGILEVIPGARGPRVQPLKHGLKQNIDLNSYRGSGSTYRACRFGSVSTFHSNVKLNYVLKIFRKIKQAGTAVVKVKTISGFPKTCSLE
jgi:hypothetical protein